MLQNVIKVLTKYGYLFADGVWITIELSLITVACSSILGSLMAILRRSRLGMVRFITSAYVEIVRGTPLLLQLYFFYFMLPQFLPFLNLSEFACVVMPCVGGPPMLLTRNLFYTALTRAKELVVLVGREDAISAMVNNNHIARRYTALCQRLGEIPAGE